MNDKIFKYFLDGITVIVVLYEICRTGKRTKRR